MGAFHSATRPGDKLGYAILAIALVLSGFWLLKVKIFSSAEAEKPAVQVKQPILNAAQPQQYPLEPMALKNEVTTPPKVQLSGIVGGVDGQRLAVISVNKSPEAVVRVGDLIFAVSTVTEINQDSLTYRHGSELIRVVMQNHKRPPQGEASSAQLPTNELQPVTNENAVSGFRTNTGTAGSQSSGDLKTGNVEFRQAFEQKMKSFQSRP